MEDETAVVIHEDVKDGEEGEEEEAAATMATDPATTRITRLIGRIQSRNWGTRRQIQ